MSIPHGKDAYFALDGVDLTPFSDSVALSNAMDTAESSTMGSDAKAFLAGMTGATVSLSGRYDSAATEIQRLTASGTVSDGTYTLGFDGETTSALDHDANNATIVAALNALDNVASGDIVLTGGTLPTTAVTFTFAQAYLAEDVPLLVVTSSLTGGGTYVASVVQRVGPDVTLAALLAGEDAVPFLYGPEGSGSGAIKYSGNAYVTAYNCTAPIGDVVAFTAEFQITGAVSRSTF